MRFVRKEVLSYWRTFVREAFRSGPELQIFRPNVEREKVRGRGRVGEEAVSSEGGTSADSGGGGIRAVSQL